MVDLSSVVGGIMRGLIESHTIADSVTVNTLESYRRHEVLSQVPVPRMAIREAHVSLRFSVSDVPQAQDSPDRNDLLDLWRSTIRDRVLPDVLRDAGRLDNRRIVDTFSRRLDSLPAADFIDPELLRPESSEEQLVAASHKYLSTVVDSLPPSTRKLLGPTDLRTSFERVLREQVPDLRAAAKKLAEATRYGDLDVLVTADSLKAVPEAQISQLDLTLTLEDVRFGTPAEGLSEQAEE